MKERDDWQCWGYGSKPHGIRGACTLRPLSLEQYFPQRGDTVLLLPESATSCLPKGGREYVLRQMIRGHKIMAEFEGIEDRNRILEIIPFKLMLPKDTLGHVYDHRKNLVGLKAVDSEGKTLGIVERMGHNGVQDIIEIKGKESFALPVVDQFIKDINIEKNHIVVVRPSYV